MRNFWCTKFSTYTLEQLEQNLFFYCFNLDRFFPFYGLLKKKTAVLLYLLLKKVSTKQFITVSIYYSGKLVGLTNLHKIPSRWVLVRSLRAIHEKIRICCALLHDTPPAWKKMICGSAISTIAGFMVEVPITPRSVGTLTFIWDRRYHAHFWVVVLTISFLTLSDTMPDGVSRFFDLPLGSKYRIVIPTSTSS